MPHAGSDWRNPNRCPAANSTRRTAAMRYSNDAFILPPSSMALGRDPTGVSNVRRLETRLRVAGGRDVKHGPTDDRRGDDLPWEQSGYQGREGREQPVQRAHPADLGSCTLHGPDEPWPKHVCRSESQGEERVLRPSFDAGPHQSAALGFVGSDAGDIAEDGLRTDGEKGSSG